MIDNITLPDRSHDERCQNGASRRNIHKSARCLFSWIDTSTFGERKRGSRHFGCELLERESDSSLIIEKLLRGSYRVAGASASDNKVTWRAGGKVAKSQMLLYRMHSGTRFAD